MDKQHSRIQELVDRPSESLAVELKRWISPDTLDGKQKIVRTALALRNFGGGYMVIGFDDKTLAPDPYKALDDVNILFHVDKIQALISKYASEQFEVSVEFASRDGQIYPVIVIPSGIRTPVAAKADLKDSENKKLISADDVYVRTLNSNNTPSTAKAIWKDWPRIIEVCFENREADIGRFMRRHLSGITPDVMREFADTIAKSSSPEASTADLIKNYLDESYSKYQEKIRSSTKTIPDHGTFEVALWLQGNVPNHLANREFLNLLASSNPNYTGWPIWLDSRSFHEKEDRSYINDGIWEAFIACDTWSPGNINSIDFMRIDPAGKFYLCRSLADDIFNAPNVPKAFTVLDFGLSILRTAESIAVGIAFAKGMKCDSSNTILSFAFRWKRLKGRHLSAWAQPGRFMYPGRQAYQDEVVTTVDVPLGVPLSSLSDYVSQAVQPLFIAFDGYSISHEVIEDFTRRLIERRL